MLGFSYIVQMAKITLVEVKRMRNLKPRRRNFITDSGFKENNVNFFSFSIPFTESILPIFEEQTGLKLGYSEKYKDYWLSIKSDNIEDAETVKQWEKKQGARVFLRDCLALSLALGLNFKDGQIGNYTELGRLEHDAKTKADIASADELAEYAAKAICDLPYYKDADCVCAPPPRPNKPFDLPSHIASKVSATISKPDITSHLSCANARDEIKEASVDEKWDIWSEAGLQYNNNGFDVNGKNIILIDDKYQSGITLQFIAMKLQEAGANNVYGLCMVKTFGDKDNQ